MSITKRKRDDESRTRAREAERTAQQQRTTRQDDVAERMRSAQRDRIAGQQHSARQDQKADDAATTKKAGQLDAREEKARLAKAQELLTSAATRIDSRRDTKNATAPQAGHAAEVGRDVPDSQTAGLEQRRRAEERVTAILNREREEITRRQSAEAANTGPESGRNAELRRDQQTRLDELTARAAGVMNGLARDQDLRFATERHVAERSGATLSAMLDDGKKAEAGRARRLGNDEYELKARQYERHVERAAAEVSDQLRPAALDRIRQRLAGIDDAVARLSDDAINRAAQEGMSYSGAGRLNAIRGQLTEELQHLEQRPAATKRGLEYVPGHPIRDQQGQKLSDGLVLSTIEAKRSGLEGGLEAKAGRRSARDLTQGRRRNTDKDDLDPARHQRDNEPRRTKRAGQLQRTLDRLVNPSPPESTRADNKRVDDRAGQLQKVLEELAESEVIKAKIKLADDMDKARAVAKGAENSPAETRVFIAGEERFLAQTAPTENLIRGVVPRGTKNSAKAIELSSTEEQIREAARVIRDELDEVEP